MKHFQAQISNADWTLIARQLDESGYALVPSILHQEVCAQLVREYSNTSIYRKTVTMERHRFGKGEYRYFRYPLPEVVRLLRNTIYPNLAPVANSWMEALQSEIRFPEELEQLQQLCHLEQQLLPTPLILRYVAGGFNTMHQDLYGKIFFPLQAVFVLDEPGKDFTGGEFVLTEQIPRAQSKAIVLNPRKGDMLIFTTQFRPEKGSKGFYRVNMKQG